MHPVASNNELEVERRPIVSLGDLPAILGIVAGIYARWVTLGNKSFWFDEGLTAWMIRLPVSEIIRMCRADVAAPLYFILERYWALIFGMSEAAIRSLSTVFATGSMGLFFLMAKRILKRPVPVSMATWLFAFSSYQVEYAKEARFYAMLSFWLLLALYCLHEFITSRSRWAFAGIVLASSASLYTHNIAFFYLASLNFFWLLYPSTDSLRRRALDMLMCDLCIAVIYLPWVPTVIAQTQWAAKNFWATPPTNLDLLIVLALATCARVWQLQSMVYELHWDSYFNDEDVAQKISMIVIALGAIPILVGLFRKSWVRIVLALAVYGLFPIAVCFMKSRMGTPIFLGRIFIGSGTVVPLLAAIPLAASRTIWVRMPMMLLAGVLLAISMLSVYAFCMLENNEDWRGAYKLVATQEREGTLVVFVANEGQLPFDYYASRDTSGKSAFARTGCPQGFFDLDPPQTVRRVVADKDLARLKEAIASGKWKQIVLLYAHEWFADEKGLVPAYLEENLILVEDEKLDRVTVMRFSVPGKGPGI